MNRPLKREDAQYLFEQAQRLQAEVEDLRRYAEALGLDRFHGGVDGLLMARGYLKEAVIDLDAERRRAA